jgi:plasmid stability protein
MAMADNNLRVPDELLAELRIKADADGRTVEEIAAEALREGLKSAPGKTSSVRRVLISAASAMRTLKASALSTVTSNRRGAGD